MNRADAYSFLAVDLKSMAEQGYTSLLQSVGQTTSRAIRIGREEVTIELSVVWEKKEGGAIRIIAKALGPSSWTLERLEESTVVSPAK